MKSPAKYLATLIFFTSLNSAIENKKALITGITGQDGSYLAEFLIRKGYEVHGIVRRISSPNVKRLEHVEKVVKKEGMKSLHIHYGDLTDATTMSRIIQEIKPDEVYNLAAQSHVGVSFEMPEYTANTDAVGVFNILEAIKNAGLAKKTKFYQASTSELYGKVHEIPQKETTPFHPRSPYAVSKLCAFWATVNYREAYGMYACNGILFNHESPRRGVDFVTRKITLALGKIVNGSSEVLQLGNLDAKRDWGYAKDYVEAMWLMLQQQAPQDFVIATGETHSVREFCELAFDEVGIKIEWKGSGVDEKGYDKKTGQLLIEIDPKYFRPSEVDYLLGDPSKAKNELGWSIKTSFKDLVKIMVAADCQLISTNER